MATVRARIGRLITAACLLTCAAAGQNEIEFYPGVTNFTSRGSIGNNAGGGDILQGIHTSAFTGLGDDGSFAAITGFGMLLQDQNTTTQESYDIVYRRGTDATGPGPGLFDVICRVGPFTSPPRGIGGATVQSHVVTTNFSGTGCRLPLCSFFAFGVALRRPPGAGWTGDGLSVHMSRGDGTFAQTVQAAATGAPDMAWQVINAATSHPSLHRSWRFRLLTHAGMLQLGNGGNLYAQGGPNPRLGSRFTARSQYGPTAAVGDSLLFLGLGRVCPGIDIQPGMRVYLAPPLFGPLRSAAPGSNAAVFDLGTTPAVSPGLTVHFQVAGVVKATGKPILTNVCTARF